MFNSKCGSSNCSTFDLRLLLLQVVDMLALHLPPEKLFAQLVNRRGGKTAGWAPRRRHRNGLFPQLSHFLAPPEPPLDTPAGSSTPERPPLPSKGWPDVSGRVG